jgi:DNA-binding NtrC family response regulator
MPPARVGHVNDVTGIGNTLSEEHFMNQRKIIYLEPVQAENSLREAFRSAGWEVHAVFDPLKAAQVMHSLDLPLGLIHLCGACNRLWEQELKSLMTAGNADWIGFGEPDCLENAFLHDLITRYLYDFHTLPVRTELFTTFLEHAFDMARLRHQEGDSSPAVAEGVPRMIGSSPKMQRVFRDIRKVARVDATVMIAGESGTGKELAARAIHNQSARAARPYVAVNCGALPVNLVQSELFGYEKGAFTGAQSRKHGRIEAANGGTIFLDEIGDLPLDLQVNLLRFLQESTIERIGSTESIRVDVRVITATHCDLQLAVDQGRFREDLYHRLNVLRLDMPPLRECVADIESLASYYFKLFSAECSCKVRGISPLALQLMKQYDWPGNIRELINKIRRAMVMCENPLITPSDLGIERRTRGRNLMTIDEARAEAERNAIQTCLPLVDYNVSEAARELGISRTTLYRLMHRYGVCTLDEPPVDAMSRAG